MKAGLRGGSCYEDASVAGAGGCFIVRRDERDFHRGAVIGQPPAADEPKFRRVLLMLDNNSHSLLSRREQKTVHQLVGLRAQNDMHRRAPPYWPRAIVEPPCR